MPVVSASMVCESTTASVTAALRESLGSSSNGSNGGCSSSVAIAAALTATGNTADGNNGGLMISSAALMPNGLNDAAVDDNDSLHSMLIASAKRVLFSKVDYEEVDNYGQAVLDTFKSKYVVIKPLANNNNIANGSSSSTATSAENGRALNATAAKNNNNAAANSNNNSSAHNGDCAPSQNVVVPNGVNSSSAADCNGSATAPITNGGSGVGNNCGVTATMTNVSSPAAAVAAATGATASSAVQRRATTVHEQPQPKRVLYSRENVRVGWKNGTRKWQIGVGMLNIGNTCYLNSTLQALFHVPSLANWLMTEQPHVDRCDGGGSDSGCIICAMYKTLLMAQTHTSPFRPYHVYSKLKAICRHLVLGRQEDAHEFLRYLVEAMEKSYLSRFRNYKELDQYSKETTPLNQILGGYLRSAVRCLSCGHVSVTFQHFQDLPLDIRKADTIEEALDGYFARERLEDMGYKCESCKKKVSATKQFYLERAPIVLCIQLKRFSVIGSKLNKQISIRLRLDLSKYQSPKTAQGACTYKLVSMITHLGASQHCGHYTAIGLTETGAYYTYDDSYVRPISTQGVCNTNSYIMFYEMEHAPSSSVPLSASPTPRSTATVTSSTQQLNRNGNYHQPQTPKTNGYPLSVKSNENNNNNNNNIITATTTPRMIGPQLPPGGLQSYSGSTATPTNTGGGIKLKNMITSGANGGSGNPKIQIHFKNGTMPSSSATSITASSTTNTSNVTTKTNTTSLSNGNGNGSAISLSNVRKNVGAAKNGNSTFATTCKIPIAIENSTCNSDPEEGVSSTTEGYADCSATATSLPSMPNLLDEEEDKSKLLLTSPATSVSSLSATSLVPYELESDDDNTGQTVIRRQSSQSPASIRQSSQSPTSMKSEHLDKPLITKSTLKRRNSCSYYENSDDNDVNNKTKKLLNGSQRQHQSASPSFNTESLSSKSTKKTEPNPIDAIFNASPKINGNNHHDINTNTTNNTKRSKTQSPQLLPETPTSPPTSDGYGSGNDDEPSSSPNNTCNINEPIQIQTKIGVWQVSDIKADEDDKKTSSSSSISPSKMLAAPPRTWTNPFSVKTSTNANEKVASSPRQNERRAQFTGNGYKAGSKFEDHKSSGGSNGAVGELLQQSHRGYGAPVLTWNGEQNDIEKELKNEAHDLRRQDLDEEDENEMDRGRQKKIKQQQQQNGRETGYEQTPGYNPFQEHDNQRRWKTNNGNNNNSSGNATSNNGNGGGVGNAYCNSNTSYRYYNSNYRQQSNQQQRNKFNHKRCNHPYNKYQRNHQHQQQQNSSNNSISSNNNNNQLTNATNNNNYAMRRES